MDHPSPFNHEIELLAYELWQERGRPLGTPETDWFKAERELTAHKPEGALSRVAGEVGSQFRAQDEPAPQSALSRMAREVGTAIGAVVALVTKVESGGV